MPRARGPRRSRPSYEDDLDLFRPPPNRPRWTELPASVQAEVIELLARLLRELARRREDVADGEMGDE